MYCRRSSNGTCEKKNVCNVYPVDVRGPFYRDKNLSRILCLLCPTFHFTKALSHAHTDSMRVEVHTQSKRHLPTHTLQPLKCIQSRWACMAADVRNAHQSPEISAHVISLKMQTLGRLSMLSFVSVSSIRARYLVHTWHFFFIFCQKFGSDCASALY